MVYHYCSICLDQKLESEVGQKCSNHHLFCNSCFSSYIQIFLNEDIDVYDVSCPLCRIKIPITKNGLIQTYHDSGNLKIRAQYINNELNGLYQEYNEENVQISEFTFVNGKMIGIRKEWYDNGNLWLSCSYDHDGKRDGLYQEFYKNGQLWKVIHYKHGLRSGLYQEYAINGKLIEEIIYSIQS